MAGPCCSALSNINDICRQPSEYSRKWRFADEPASAALFRFPVERRWCARRFMLKVLDRMDDWSVIDEQIFAGGQV